MKRRSFIKGVGLLAANAVVAPLLQDPNRRVVGKQITASGQTFTHVVMVNRPVVVKSKYQHIVTWDFGVVEPSMGGLHNHASS